MCEATAQERDLITIFQARVTDLALSDEQSHAQHLLRWIRAREGDISKAEEMLRRHVEWLKANNIGPSILEWKPSSYLTDTYCAKFCGYDFSGAPILLFTFGQWDLRPALSRGEKENVIRYKDQCLEKIMTLMRLYENQRKMHKNELSTVPDKVTQFNCICDWAGFSLRYIMSKEVVEVILEAARSFEANYPETLKGAYNVNCPKVFDVLFKLVKPFLSEHTLSKIFIYDSNESKWKPQILSNLPIEQIPVRYGGTRQKLWDLAHLNLDLNQDASFFNEIFTLSNNLECDNELEGYQAVELPSFDKIAIPIVIKSCGTVIKWNVKMEKASDEIDFAIYAENSASVGEREVCAELKLTSADKGSIQCEHTGNYWISFTNSGVAMNEPKTVFYKLALDISE